MCWIFLWTSTDIRAYSQLKVFRIFRNKSMTYRSVHEKEPNKTKFKNVLLI